MKNQIWLPAVFLAAILLQSCAPGKMLTLDGAYRPGQQFKYRLTEDTETRTERANFNGEIVPPSLSTEHKVTDYTYTVQTILPDRGVVLGMVITQLFKVETDRDGVKTYDSADPFLDTTDLSNRVFGAIIGAPFQFTISPTGRVSAFQGMNQVWENIEREAAKDSPMAGDMLVNFKTQFGDETMTDQQNELWGFLPEAKVRVGQRWKRQVNLRAFGIKGSTTYTLREHNESGARITFSSRYATDPGKPAILDMGGFQIKYVLTGKGTGTILTDQPAALPRRIAQELTMGGPMEIKMPTMGWIKVPIRITMKSVMERVK